MIFTRDEVQARQIRRVTVRLGDKHKGVLGYVDRGAILPVVYAAFSKASSTGIWGRLTTVSPVLLLVVNIVLLTSVMVTTALASAGWVSPPRTRSRSCSAVPRRACPAVSDGPRAAPAATVGLTVLPLMLFHQIQLTVCVSLARRYAARPVTPQPAELVRLVGVGISDRVVRVATPKRCKRCRYGNAG